MHHLQLSFSVPVCIFLSVCTQVRRTEAEEYTADSVKKLKSACKKDGEILQITEVFFCNQPDYSPCDYNCKPVDESQPPSLCFAPSDSHRHNGCNNTARCRLRLSLNELNKVYEAVDTEHSSGNVDELLDARENYVFHYVCGDGENQKQINPCRGHKDNSLGENYTSLLIRHYPSDHSECRTVCDLEQRGPFKLKINFLLADTATNKHVNFMAYKTYSNSNNDDDDDDATADAAAAAATAVTAAAAAGADEDEWTMVHSGYVYEYDGLFTNSIIKIRLHFNDLSTIRRFWISLGGQPFRLKCTPEQVTTTQHGGTLDTTVSTSPYRTEKPSTGQAGNEAYTYVVPVVIIALVIGSAIVGMIFVRRRHKLSCAKVSSQQEQQRESQNPDNGDNEHYYSEVVPDSNEAQYMEVLPVAEQSFTEDSLGYLEPRINVLASNYDTADFARSTDVHVYTSLP